MKTCSGCKKEKAGTEFHRCGARSHLDGLNNYCKDCVNEVNRRTASKRVSKYIHKIKASLVEEAGGSCRICGYNESLNALCFHHLDPIIKEFPINKARTYSKERLRKEAAKCALLCLNCHAEVHAGLHDLEKIMGTHIAL